MSVDYYIRLEQGRGPTPSPQMLASISRALRLSDDERAYLRHLTDPEPALRTGPGDEVRPGVLHLIERLNDTPALVCNARYDVLAWNRMAAALLGDFSALPAAERNIVWRFFTDPAARARHDPAGADQFARESVADLRAASARYPDDAAIRALIDRLNSVSADFRDLLGRRRGVHPPIDPQAPPPPCRRLAQPGLRRPARSRARPLDHPLHRSPRHP